MISFKNDYSEGAHETILKALVATNAIQCEGYGQDQYSDEARTRISEIFDAHTSDIHFFVGGTQTNLTAISAFLRPHQAVISAHTGHVLVHETGAIEATGHKILGVSSECGKLTPELIKAVLDEHVDEHMVMPKLVYLSNATEIGTIYTKNELENIWLFARANDLYVYLDGARLGAALTSKASDLKPSDLTKYTDAYYIGATKNGGLLGEALVINREELKHDFRFLLKQRGAMLAKGKVIGIQFNELFKDELYFKLAQHANEMAQRLTKEIANKGYGFWVDSSTNQIFPIFPNTLIKKLENNFSFYHWCSIDEQHSAIRLVTSWMTQYSQINRFSQAI